MPFQFIIGIFVLDLENLEALISENKTVSMSSKRSRVSLATDGNLDASRLEFCARTKNESRPYLRINLEKSYFVTIFRLFTTRNALKSGRFSNAEFGVSFLLHRKCGEFRSKNHTGEIVDIQCWRHSRDGHAYVRLSKTGYLTVCELQVYGIERK